MERTTNGSMVEEILNKIKGCKLGETVQVYFETGTETDYVPGIINFVRRDDKWFDYEVVRSAGLDRDGWLFPEGDTGQITESKLIDWYFEFMYGHDNKNLVGSGVGVIKNKDRIPMGS